MFKINSKIGMQPVEGGQYGGEVRSLPPCISKVAGGKRGTLEMLERIELWWSNLEKMKEGRNMTPNCLNELLIESKLLSGLKESKRSFFLS